MNRRSFLASSTAALACAALPLTLTGCDNTTIADFVSVIATDAASLAQYFGAGSIASQITTLAGQIATDIQNWQTGGAAANAIQAINDLIGLINSIPIASNYAPLIVLILSALTGLLALLPSSTAAKATLEATRKYSVKPTHYAGYDKKTMTKGKKDFTTSWSALIAILPLTK